MIEELKELLKTTEVKEFIINDSTFKVIDQRIFIYSEIFKQLILVKVEDFTHDEINEIMKKIRR